MGQRQIQIPRATQVAVGNSFMAALCDGDVWVWFAERAPIGELDADRDDRIPAKLDSPPRRAWWAGWSKDSSGARENLSDFEAEWAERGGTSSEVCPSELDDERIVRIACGWDDVLVLKANGEVWLGDAHDRSWQFVSFLPLLPLIGAIALLAAGQLRHCDAALDNRRLRGLVSLAVPRHEPLGPRM